METKMCLILKIFKLSFVNFVLLNERYNKKNKYVKKNPSKKFPNCAYFLLNLKKKLSTKMNINLYS